MPDIRRLRDAIKPSQTNRGDGRCPLALSLDFSYAYLLLAISSVVIAIQMINTYTKKLKYKRKIVLVTNGTGPINNEQLDEIQKKIQDDGIELIVLYVFL
jgi:ATP-dependent DNA helicase 2 subunit 2